MTFPSAPAESLAYHRAARANTNHRGWRLPVAGLIGAVSYFILLAFAGLFLLIYAVAADSTEIKALFEDTSSIDLTNPAVFTFLMLSVILMLPVLYGVLAAVRYVPLGRISSVEGHLRWGWLGDCLLWAFVVFGLGFAVTFGLYALAEPSEFSAPVIDRTAITMLILVLLLVPLQSTAEEYVFRGYLMQLIGQWLKNPVWAILLPVPLFALAHLYNIWGLLDVAVFGVGAAILVWRTGGLEAAIAAHVANNVLLFILSSITVISIDTEGGSPEGVVSTIVIVGAFIALTEWRATRLRVVRTVPTWVPGVVT